MKPYRGLDQLPAAPRERCVALGFFDGLHRGHARILGSLRDTAAAEGRSSLVLTFHPHPLSVVRPERAPRLLCSTEERLGLLAGQGLDELLLLPFTPELAARSYEDFTRELLVGRLGMRHLVAGYDFHLGAGRRGSAEAMTALGAQLGFRVDVVAPVYRDERPVSSTVIRQRLEAGRMEEVADLLGHPYRIAGPVIRGEGRGRGLGFPTANLGPQPAEKLLPPEGVYRAEARWEGSPPRPGLLNLGRAPSFRDRFVPELHLPGFSGDLYGKTLEIDVLQWIRPERRFPDAEALARQIREDLKVLDDGKRGNS